MSETKHVVLGVTGGIAAYKAADLVSKLTNQGVEVKVVMTQAATELVTARTFQTLSRNNVLTNLWETPDWKPEHVALSNWADLMVIAPCTANTLAKIAHGIGDDALSTCVIANQAPLLVAPAMNPAMWNNPAVQANVATLQQRGVHFAGPVCGHVACGADGTGRMVEPLEIMEKIFKLLNIEK